MKLFGSKKSEALTIIVIVVIILVFLGWVINVGSRECKNNSQCGSGQYCGSDYACHQIPTIEKTTVKNNLILPSIIIGIAIVMGAVIIRYGKSYTERRNEAPRDQQEQHYTGNLRMP
jgi:uncharacterized ion transporter superfamily protein YfcC